MAEAVTIFVSRAVPYLGYVVIRGRRQLARTILPNSISTEELRELLATPAARLSRCAGRARDASRTSLSQAGVRW